MFQPGELILSPDPGGAGGGPGCTAGRGILPADAGNHDCADLVQLIKTIYARQQTAHAAGRKGGQVDECYRKRAEDTLYGELAVALDIPREQVEEYIRRTLKE